MAVVMIALVMNLRCYFKKFCFLMQVKAVCSSGGHFVKLTGGGLEYQGGETRLIQVPNFCRYSELLESLERLAGNIAGSSSGSSSSVSSTRLLPWPMIGLLLEVLFTQIVTSFRASWTCMTVLS